MATAQKTAKLPFSFYTQNAGKSLRVARELYNNGKNKFGNWSVCMKLAWSKIKLLAIGTVTFKKVTSLKNQIAEVRTANILPIGNYTAFFDFDPNYPNLFKAIDADKLATAKDPKEAIISFYLNRVVY